MFNKLISTQIYNQQPASPVESNVLVVESKPKNYMIFSILTCLFCSLSALCLAIVPLLYSRKVSCLLASYVHTYLAIWSFYW